MIRLTRTVLLMAFATVIACAPVFRNHGYVPTQEDLSNVIIGVDTRASVEEVLGAPTTGGVANKDGFYYIKSRWRHFGALPPKPIERSIVAVAFDENDVVSNISHYGLEDGKVVVLSRRVTEGGAQEIGFIQQLMGNFGRLDASQVFGDG